MVVWSRKVSIPGRVQVVATGDEQAGSGSERLAGQLLKTLHWAHAEVNPAPAATMSPDIRKRFIAVLIVGSF